LEIIMTEEKIEPVVAETSEPKKKEYSRPELKAYGDVRSITQGGATSALSDSGANMMSPP